MNRTDTTPESLGPRIGPGGDFRRYAAFSHHQPVFSSVNDILDIVALVAPNDHEVRLNRPHRLVFPHAEVDCGRAILVPALTYHAQLTLAALPRAGLLLEPLVEGTKAHLVFRHLPLARLHESDSKPIQISQAG